MYKRTSTWHLDGNSRKRWHVGATEAGQREHRVREETTQSTGTNNEPTVSIVTHETGWTPWSHTHLARRFVELRPETITELPYRTTTTAAVDFPSALNDGECWEGEPEIHT